MILGACCRAAEIDPMQMIPTKLIVNELSNGKVYVYK